MHVVLRRMEDLGGLHVATDEALETDRVTLGRGTDQHVQLPDVRVTLAHAEIRQQPGGGYRIECTGENPVSINGTPVQAAALGAGDVIDLGRFRLTVRPPGRGTDLLLEIDERVTAREEQGRRRQAYRMDLAQAGLRKRRPAWGLVALVLLPLFVAPLAARYAARGDAGASLDAVWQAGPPSASHSAFVQDCDTCHQAPFVSVRNEACLACHRDQPHHSADPAVLALPGITDARCGACHQEHSGRDALVARRVELCTGCHARPDEQYAVAQLPPVRRFGGDHPGFTLSLPAWTDGRPQHVEVAQDGGARLREDSRLRFPHDVHVAAKGLGSPDGLRVLGCSDCHRPMAAGFAPIRMEDQCAGCHRLDFDPDAPDRHVPHRAAAEVAAVIRDYYARIALAGEVRSPAAPEVVRLLRRPGEVLTREQSQAALAWADARAAEAMQDVFERRVCAGCHAVTATGDAQRPYEIEPVAMTPQFLAGARFDHAAHRTEKCERCHEARTSHESADVLIPPIANCRGCHTDPGGPGGLLETACVDCHGFHVTGRMAQADSPVEPRP